MLLRTTPSIPPDTTGGVLDFDPTCPYITPTHNDPIGVRKKAIMAFDLSAYETVAERLQRAHNDHPDLRIITRILDIVRDEQTKRPIQYVVEASVYYGDVLKAVDVAEEIVGSSPVNKTSALENCSTSAAGRALSLAGYLGVDPATKKPTRPSRNEMEKAQRATEMLKPRQFTGAEILLVESLIATVNQSSSKDDLRTIYKENADLLECKVNGIALIDAINKRVAQLGNANVKQG